MSKAGAGDRNCLSLNEMQAMGILSRKNWKNRCKTEKKQISTSSHLTVFDILYIRGYIHFLSHSIVHLESSPFFLPKITKL